MQFLLLWSGDVRGMKKARIDSIENRVGTVGTLHKGKFLLPCADQIRAALPYRFRASFDRATNRHGLPQVWQDARNNSAPLVMRLLNYRMKPLVTLYLQPLNKESE